jgi:hypothetical protein
MRVHNVVKTGGAIVAISRPRSLHMPPAASLLAGLELSSQASRSPRTQLRTTARDQAPDRRVHSCTNHRDGCGDLLIQWERHGGGSC